MHGFGIVERGLLVLAERSHDDILGWVAGVVTEFCIVMLDAVMRAGTCALTVNVYFCGNIMAFWVERHDVSATVGRFDAYGFATRARALVVCDGRDR